MLSLLNFRIWTFESDIMNRGIIRQATLADIWRLMDLLHQVNMVHHHLRPELFKPNTTKYSEQELETLLGDESKPIFV